MQSQTSNIALNRDLIVPAFDYADKGNAKRPFAQQFGAQLGCKVWGGLQNGCVFCGISRPFLLSKSDIYVILRLLAMGILYFYGHSSPFVRQKSDISVAFLTWLFKIDACFCGHKEEMAEALVRFQPVFSPAIVGFEGHLHGAGALHLFDDNLLHPLFFFRIDTEV